MKLLIIILSSGFRHNEATLLIMARFGWVSIKLVNRIMNLAKLDLN